ncbi:hypothetical protein [Streptomyces sp. NBC_01435]|nr:hypothetical protein [Streptomyces sp. NBC_01435]
MENSHAQVMRPAPAGPVVPARSPNVWVAPVLATVLSFFLT